MADVTTNLAIKISADTSAATTSISSVGKSVEDMATKFSGVSKSSESAFGGIDSKLAGLTAGITPVTAGIAAAAAAMTAFGLASAGALSALRSGGEFNEAKKGFESLAASSGVSGKAIVASLQQISGGTISVRESMESASKAIRAGFSEDQISAVYSFAKRYSEATGAGFTETAENITKALQTGRTQSLKQYGIMLEDGATFASAFGQITDLTKAFGGGAFNFGDIEVALSKQLGNLADSIGATWNDMLGESVTGDALEQLVASMTKLVDMGPQIAESLGAPVIAVFDVLVTTGRQLYDVYSTLSDLTGVSLVGAFKGFAATALAVASFIGSEFNAALRVMTGLVGIAIEEWAWFMDAIGATDKAKGLEKLGEKISAIRIETGMLDKAATGLKYGFDSQDKSAESLAKKHADLSGTVKDSSKAMDKAAESAGKAALEMERLDKASAIYALKEAERSDKRVADIAKEDKAYAESSGKRTTDLTSKLDGIAKEEAAALKLATTQEQVAMIRAEFAGKSRAAEEESAKAKVDAEIAREQQLTDRKRAAEIARLENESKAFDESEKRAALNAKIEKESNADRVDDMNKLLGATKTFATERNKVLTGATTGVGVDSATAALIADAEKSRASSSMLATIQTRLANAIEALVEKGSQMKITVTNGDNAIGQLVRRVIQESELQAELSGATVPAV